ncbi:protein of unknown function DUF29 [Microseira wollei NIES-4236]|uniref:Uncharacterized protein n=1 Tax=Microseira wollei NIES-4236 TaxID=2530354 RepID=A0AAV3XQF8_9CYAN|nr:hypothetical protein [Microseira wollei]GET42490.1 protein of unknown function DUF29 [Microseira wollei NIES-4236]
MIEEEFEAAIDAASAEVWEGIYTPFELLEIVDKIQVMENARKLLALNYAHSAKDLPAIVKENIVELQGGEEWKEGRQK